jgi:ribonuclease E
VLRSIEEEGMRRRSAEICVHVPTTVALYILNQKRDSLVQLEARYAIRVLVAQDDALIPPAFRLERLRAYAAAEPAVLPAAPLTQASVSDEEEEEEIDEAAEEAAESPETERESGEGHGRSRRRRRRRRHHEEEPASQSATPTAPTGDEAAEDEADLVAENTPSESAEIDGDEESDAERRRRRRGRRGGRRRVRREGGVEPGFEEPRPAVDTVEILPTPEVQESEQTLVEARASWPEIGAAAIETASLPALAGDGQASGENISAADESEPAAAGPADTAGYEAPSRDAPDGERESRPGSPPTAEAEQGVPYTGEMERELESASAELEEQRRPESAQPVETVTEKPANPRRGWWQRLIQS